MTAPQAACLAEALAAGHARLHRGAAALEAVEAAIRLLEGSGLFNAGTGSRLQLDGARRMDAALMEGRRLRAGAVAGIERVRHPIAAARLVLERTDHVLLAGEPATRFALRMEPSNNPRRRRLSAAPRALRPARGGGSPTLRLFEALRAPRRIGSRGTGTVGAVAVDRRGSVAAGASTGGVALMLPGRVGDTPLIGCGVYADDLAGAVSMTGVGEGIIRLAVAKAIADRLAGGATPEAAARLVLASLVRRLRGAAGALVLAPDGRFAIRHTTPYMCAGYWDGRRAPVVTDRFR